MPDAYNDAHVTVIYRKSKALCVLRCAGLFPMSLTSQMLFMEFLIQLQPHMVLE